MSESGYERIKEELERRGLTKNQINSKAVAVTLDVIANAENKTVYTDIYEAEQELSYLIAKCESLNTTIACYQHNVEKYEEELQSKKSAVEKRARKEWEEQQKYIDEFYEKLNACETHEGRDALRRAQTFCNSVSVDTKYDNTAFIVALGAILSCGGYEPMTELRKINKKVPDPMRVWKQCQSTFGKKLQKEEA